MNTLNSVSKKSGAKQRLVKVARSNVSYGSCSSIFTHSYEKVDRDYKFSETVPPYVLCALRCVDVTTKWAVRMGYKKDEMRFVFEDGSHVPKGCLYEWMEREGYLAPIFEPKAKHRGLELADFYSWEHTKILRRLKNYDFSDFRKSLLELNKIPHATGLFLEHHMRAMCRNNLIPRRVRIDL
jgi:hypothetical protein